MTYSGVRRHVALSVCLPMLLAMAPGGTVAQDPPAVVVHALDENAAPLPGACFAIVTAEQDAYPTVSPVCDGDDGSADGTVTFGAGRYAPGVDIAMRVVMVEPPEGYQVAASESFTHDPAVAPLMDIDVTSTPGGDEVIFLVMDAAGVPVPGTCVALYPADSFDVVAMDCGEPDAVDGAVRLTGLQPGDYGARLTGVPAGLMASSPEVQPVTVTSGETTTVDLALVSSPTISLRLVGPGGAAVKADERICFSVWPVGDIESGRRGYCGTADTRFNLPAGDYQAKVDTKLDGLSTEGRSFSLAEDEAATISFPARPAEPVADGRWTIVAVDGKGVLIPGACFAVAVRGGFPSPFCDDRDGERDGRTVVTGIIGDVYVEVAPPDRWVPKPAFDDISVADGAEITWKFKKRSKK